MDKFYVSLFAFSTSCKISSPCSSLSLSRCLEVTRISEKLAYDKKSQKISKIAEMANTLIH